MLPPEDEDIEDFYRIPLRSPFTWNSPLGNQPFANSADFMTPPGRPPRKKGGSGNLKENGTNGELVFDEDGTIYAASTSTRTHSKLWSGTDSTVVTSDEERSIGHSRH